MNYRMPPTFQQTITITITSSSPHLSSRPVSRTLPSASDHAEPSPAPCSVRQMCAALSRAPLAPAHRSRGVSSCWTRSGSPSDTPACRAGSNQPACHQSWMERKTSLMTLRTTKDWTCLDCWGACVCVRACMQDCRCASKCTCLQVGVLVCVQTCLQACVQTVQCQWSDGPLVRWPIDPTTHWFDFWCYTISDENVLFNDGLPNFSFAEYSWRAAFRVSYRVRFRVRFRVSFRIRVRLEIRIKVKTKGTPLWGTHCLKVLKCYRLRL